MILSNEESEEYESWLFQLFLERWLMGDMPRSRYLRHKRRGGTETENF
jgi:hypothetical protein